VVLAAIDIGSNAARLLIEEVVEDDFGNPQFYKLNLIRVALRLGFDVFETGEISKVKKAMLFQTMKAFSHLLKVYQVEHLKACATSAMRDAANSQEIIRKVKMETDIEIQIISGQEEAAYIYENHFAENLDKQHDYLYIDVGGGSTELTFFSQGISKSNASFNIGTIRLLKDRVHDTDWEEMKQYLKTNIKTKLPLVAIGSGGNINKVFSMSKKKEGKPLSIELLRDFYKELSAFSVQERMRIYNLRSDRADVIIPALQIYINVMRWADINEIYVPKIGLADGLIKNLYEEITHKKINSSLKIS
jgi:exopolyphosphatase/guanosine-5'-triphosphate,3'-diphosphate pyrophosphatase